MICVRSVIPNAKRQNRPNLHYKRWEERGGWVLWLGVCCPTLSVNQNKKLTQGIHFSTDLSQPPPPEPVIYSKQHSVSRMFPLDSILHMIYHELLQYTQEYRHVNSCLFHSKQDITLLLSCAYFTLSSKPVLTQTQLENQTPTSTSVTVNIRVERSWRTHIIVQSPKDLDFHVRTPLTRNHSFMIGHFLGVH